MSVMPSSVETQPYHHGALRDAALNAALLRLRRGEKALPSVRDLAREIAVTHRALYRHFADRSALSAAVAGEGFELLAAAMTLGDDRNITARSVMRAYVDFAFAETSLYRLMFSLGSSALMRNPAPGPQVRRVIAIATEVFDDGGDANETRNRVVSAWGMAHGLFELWYAGALRASDPDRAKDFILARLAHSRLI